MKSYFKKLTVFFVLISLTFSQTGLIYLGPFLSPKKAKAGIEMDPAPQGSISLEKGWNLISVSDETLSSEYLAGCEINSGPWEWKPDLYKYQKVSTLEPLRAYWVRVAEDCELDVGSSGEGTMPPPGGFSTELETGWNLIASSANYNWGQIQGSCNLKVNWLFDASGNDYGMLSPKANLEAFRGYWVKVESDCHITEPVINFDDILNDLIGVDSSFNCYLSQGAPSDACDEARIIERDGTTYCRYYDKATCEKNNAGYYEWQCGEKHEEPAPSDYNPEDPQYICTEKEGWKKAPESEDEKDELRWDLCNITGSILSNLLGSFAQDFSGEVLVGLFGEDVAKNAQALVDFYFWLKSQGIDPAEVINDPDYFSNNIDQFVDAGVEGIKDVAPQVIKKFIIEFAIELDIDTGAAQEIGNFISYLAEEGINRGSLPAASNTEEWFEILWDGYIKENSSPLVKKILKAQKLINLVATGLNIEGEASQYEIIQALTTLASAKIEKIKEEYNLTDQQINDVQNFVKFLIENKGLSLQEIIQKNKSSLEQLWIDYAQANGVTLQKGIDIIRQAAYTLAAEAANKLLDIVEIDAEVDGEMVQKAIDDRLLEKSIQFIKFLVFDKGYDFSELSVQLESHGVEVLLDEAGISVEVDSQQFVEEAVAFLSDKITEVLEENFKISPELAKYVLDFVNYTVNAQGKNLSTFLEFKVDQFISSFESYLIARGKAVLTQIVQDVITPYIEETTGMDPEIIAEAARFAKFLTETKNISIEELQDYALDRVEELLIEFAAKKGEKLTGIRYDVLHRLFKIIVNQHLIQDIVHLDLMAVIEKLVIEVDISGNFACPTDLISAVCTLLNGNNWEDCSVGNLNPQGLSSPAHTVRLYDENVKPASIGICTVPNIYISILGEPIIQGINLKVGPIAYRGTKLRLDMPTSNKIDWEDGSEKDSLYQATKPGGLIHTYSGGGGKSIYAKCRFILNIDIFGFHWPTVTQKVNKNISVP